MCNRVFGLQAGLRWGIFAGAVLVAVGVTPAHAQSGGGISPPATVQSDSTPSSDHVRKPTEPPPFDPNRPAARAARAKAAATPPAAPAPRSDAAQPEAPTRSAPAPAPRTTDSTPHATSPRPAASTIPSAEAAPPRRAATFVDPWAEPATPPAPVSRPTARQRTIDPWAEPATAPAPVSRPTTRQRSEPAKVIGIDSLGRPSEELSPEPSPARPRRGAGPAAEAAPAETTDEALPR